MNAQARPMVTVAAVLMWTTQAFPTAPIQETLECKRLALQQLRRHSAVQGLKLQ